MDKIFEILGSFNIPTVLSIAVVFWYFTRDLKSEMKLLEAKIDRQSERTDRLYEMFQEQLNSQVNRTDKLYEMFIDALKERNKI